MSETTSTNPIGVSTATESGAKKIVTEKIVLNRISKIPLLVGLLALSCTGYIAYEGMFGPNSIERQVVINNQQNKQIINILVENKQLANRVEALEQRLADMGEQLRTSNPSQNNLLLNQLNGLISGANQSLLLYHDFPGAIKQLSYARQLLQATDDPLFSEVKVNLVKDLDGLQAQNSFDNTMLATQLNELYQQTAALNVVQAAETLSPTVVMSNEPAWRRFLAGIKSSLMGLVKVAKTNPANGGALMVPENEMLIRQHLNLDYLNAKQALLTHDQALWSSSLQDALNLLQQFFTQDQINQKQQMIIKQLQQVNFGSGAGGVNLDLTMQSLIKIEQLNSGKF